jgi:hypothetical protein
MFPKHGSNSKNLHGFFHKSLNWNISKLFNNKKQIWINHARRKTKLLNLIFSINNGNTKLLTYEKAIKTAVKNVVRKATPGISPVY